MDIETLRTICKKLSGVTEDVKWGNDLCFLVAGKMFCVAGLNAPLSISMKVTDEEFEELTATPGIVPAPYVARYKWILIEDMNRFTKAEWKKYITQSYELVRSKLSKKLLKEYHLD